MKIKLTEKQVKESHPQEFEDLKSKMTKKNCDPEKFNWCYDYCIVLSGPQPTTLQEALDGADKKYGISLTVSEGRKRSSVRIDKTPEVFLDMIRSSWQQKVDEHNAEDRFVDNMDRVLKLAGKSGSAKNNEPKSPGVINGLDIFKHMADLASTPPRQFPTLDDIKTHANDEYQKRLSMADGTQIVKYSPAHKESDEWGFIFIPIKLATRRLKDDNNQGNRFIEDCKTNTYYTINNNSCFFEGFLNGVDKAMNAKEGSEFTGWKRTKQYRLTFDEIKSEIGGKIFTDGGVNFGGVQRSMGSGFRSFGIM